MFRERCFVQRRYILISGCYIYRTACTKTYRAARPHSQRLALGNARKPNATHTREHVGEAARCSASAPRRVRALEEHSPDHRARVARRDAAFVDTILWALCMPLQEVQEQKPPQTTVDCGLISPT